MTIELNSRLKPFIKEIFVIESNDESAENRLPFYADGYPGIVYAQTANGVTLMPQNKQLSEFFLYGLTIEPIELQIQGAYKLIVFQLYPFATRLLIGVDPKALNDECFDLLPLSDVEPSEFLGQIRLTESENQIEVISGFIVDLIARSSSNADNTIKLAVASIINAKGKVQIKSLREQLFISERTFERKFTHDIGVTPKQFAKIIQFNFSLNQIQESDYTQLTNVAYDNGFSDQSHFIRTFKKYTGKTPKELLPSIG